MTRKRRNLAPLPAYPRFRKIDGRHSYRSAVPDGHVVYRARRLRGSEVAFFNFALAREMGLIPETHADRLTTGLRRAILDAFSIRIINEYDLERKTRFPRRDLLDRTYMATRYLALQHPGRTGKTSGDGRSIWNGQVEHRGARWDVTSCGTGVTRLCPATAETRRFFKTGNWRADYGCGTSTLREGMMSALMSETFHRNEIATERVLAVIALADGFAITVRAGRNLLRPSHFFVHLKQGKLESLRAAVECHYEREVANGRLPSLDDPHERYARLAEEIARTFARTAARFEREYIFCWLDWDGDNILADGGIIDYGSVRQFGLFHRGYRFDDGPRWSTTITEQRRKARHIVQTFAQLREFLVRGERPTLASVARDRVLRLFDEEFLATRDRLLLRDVGFDATTREALLGRAATEVAELDRAHRPLEHARSARGPHRVSDGISWNAIFCMRDLLRELPQRLLAEGDPLPPRAILDLALSSYASKRDRRMTPHRRRQALRFQRAYLALVERAAELTGRSVPSILADVGARSKILNRADRITGDAIVHAAERLTRGRKRLGCEGVYAVVDGLARRQTRLPERSVSPGETRTGIDAAERLLDGISDLLLTHRHGL